MKPDTIVLIHGLWVTSLSWENWATRFSARGLEVINRDWPGLEVGVKELRRTPAPIAALGVAEVVEFYERIIRELERPPIIMGHSFGGLVTQILLDRGLGAAGVALASAPVKGIWLLPFSTISVITPALINPLNNHRAVPLTPEQFHYAFTNTMPPEESRRIFDRYAVPGPDHMLFQAASANLNPGAATAVNVRNEDRAPLLLVAGSEDHISPPSLVRANAALYRHSAATTEYLEFAERTHFMMGQPHWEEVADLTLRWALENAR